MAESIRVLELGEGVPAAYAAKLLGDQGADVIKVEAPSGDLTRRRGPFPGGREDPERSGLFLALNTNKRGVCLDLESPADRGRFDHLVAWADIVVHNLPPDRADELSLAPVSVLAQHPELVVVSITPFGITGPHSRYSGSELIVSHSGGWAGLCPATHMDPDLPPLKVFGHQCAFMAGMTGALSGLASYRHARDTGVGEHVDVSEQACVASVLEAGIPLYTYVGEVGRRYGKRSLVPWRIFQASDQPVFLVCIEDDQWERLVAFMGNPDWASLEVFETMEARAENQDLLHTLVQEFVGAWSAAELYTEGQKRRICIAPVMSFEQLATSEHLRARAAFATVAHPVAGPVEHLAPAVLTTRGRADLSRGAPTLGQHSDDVFRAIGRVGGRSRPAAGAGTPGLPLGGVRVVDLTWAWAGPFAGMQLAHLGAEVIRVESGRRPDLYRRLPLCPPDLEMGLNRSGMFNQWNQGKASVALDLSQPAAVEVVKDLVAVSDVVVQNFATGVMDRLGIGYDVLRGINPGVVMASISGYGQSGPYREYMGYGPAIPPLTGLSAVTGYVGGGPEEFGLSMPDPTAGLTAAWAVVAALEERDRTGRGEHLDVSLWEATAAFSVEAWMQHAFDGTQPERMGNRDPHMAPHGCFRCRGEDMWVAIACADDTVWERLARIIDPGLVADERFRTLAGRKRHEEELERAVSVWTAELDRWDITRELQAAGIAAMPTYACDDVIDDPHLNERGFIERLEHPEVGRRAHTGIPWRLTRRPNGVRAPAPCLGADTPRVLTDVLGYAAERVAALAEQGALG